MDYLPLLLLIAGIGVALWIMNKVVDSYTKVSDSDVEEIRERWAREEAEREAFRQSARRLHAKIVTAFQFGMVNLKPNLQLTLHVEDPEGAYDVDVEKYVEFVELPDYKEGRTVEVLVDPKDKKHVVVEDVIEVKRHEKHSDDDDHLEEPPDIDD